MHFPYCWQWWSAARSLIWLAKPVPSPRSFFFILLIFSVISWAIILSKWSLLRRARVQSGRFLRAFRKAQRLQDVCHRSRAVQAQPAGSGV